MVDVYRTDEEQAEAIKKWWKENGTAVIIGVVIGLSGIIGVRYWFQYERDQSHSASLIYAQMSQSLDKSEQAQVESKGQQLLNEFAGTEYAVFAALAMAKVAVEAGQADKAATHLQWVLDNANSAMQHVARLRLARLWLSTEQLDNAEALLQGVKAAGFDGAYEELRGDIQLARGNETQARERYRLALASATGTRREFVQMKLDNIAVASAAVPTSE